MVGVAAHTEVPPVSEAEASESLKARSSRLGQHGETPPLQKNTKISQAWWHAPIVPATHEVEAGELLEPRRQRLQ